MELTGTSGMPVPEGAQVADPPGKFVVFQTCAPAATPKPP